MRSVILAGGRGLRIRSLTGSLPKHLLTVGCETIIERLLRQITQAGISEHVICTRKKNDPVEQHIRSHDRSFGRFLFVQSRGNKAADLVAALTEASEKRTNLLVVMGDAVFPNSAIGRFVRLGFPSESINIIAGVTDFKEGVSGVYALGNINGFTRKYEVGAAPSAGIYLMRHRAAKLLIANWNRSNTSMSMLIDYSIKLGLSTRRRFIKGAYDINTPSVYGTCFAAFQQSGT